MTRTKSWNNRKLESVLHRAADNLSATEVATLVEFPDAVRLALIVAANALSSEEADSSHIDKSPIETIRGETPHYVSSADAYRQMSKRTKPGKSEDLLTTSELAAQIGLKTRQCRYTIGCERAKLSAGGALNADMFFQHYSLIISADH